jgi:hypothetical protein
VTTERRFRVRVGTTPGTSGKPTPAIFAERLTDDGGEWESVRRFTLRYDEIPAVLEGLVALLDEDDERRGTKAAAAARRVGA